MLLCLNKYNGDLILDNLQINNYVSSTFECVLMSINKLFNYLFNTLFNYLFMNLSTIKQLFQIVKVELVR